MAVQANVQPCTMSRPVVCWSVVLSPVLFAEAHVHFHTDSNFFLVLKRRTFTEWPFMISESFCFKILNKFIDFIVIVVMVIASANAYELKFGNFHFMLKFLR